jgi:hypothetical protein
MPQSEAVFGTDQSRILALVRGPELGSRGCHVNVQATRGANFHVYYYRTASFWTDVTGWLGQQPFAAAEILSSILAAEVSTATGAGLSAVYDRYMSLGWHGSQRSSG